MTLFRGALVLQKTKRRRTFNYRKIPYNIDFVENLKIYIKLPIVLINKFIFIEYYKGKVKNAGKAKGL
jgi:hypothetical protein